MPNLSELHALVIDWAKAKGIFDQPQPLGQMAKTLEEIEEAKEAIARQIDRTQTTSEQIYDECWNEHGLALELGDILVTLCIQAAMQGTSLGEIVPLHPNPYQANGVKREWENVSIFAGLLYGAIQARVQSPWSPWNPQIIYTHILSLYVCVTDAAQSIGHTPEQCLEMAYDKIKGRKGTLNEQGQFVKSA